MPRLDRLRIENFRGATVPFVLDLPTSQKLTVIFGENGTGKTTIVDALDAVGNCYGGSIVERSSATIREHLPTLGKTTADISVEVWSGKQKWSATVRSGKIVSAPVPRPLVCVLRRSMLQQFVDSAPADRYKAIRHLINVGNVEKSEDALKKAADDANGRLTQAANRRSEAELQLNDLWLAEGAPSGTAEEWAHQLTAREQTDLTALIGQIRRVQIGVEAAELALASSEQAQAVRSSWDNEWNSVQRAVAAHPGISTNTGLRLVELLSAAQTYLGGDPNPNSCPVCNQSVDGARLTEQISIRLGEMKTLHDLANRRSNAESTLTRAEAQAESAIKDVVLKAGGLHKSLALFATDYPAELPAIQNVLATLGAWGAAAPGYDQAVAFISACSALRPVLQSRVDATNQTLGKLNAIRQLLERSASARLETEQLARMPEALARVRQIVRSTRIEFTEQILSDVAQECNRLYAQIHPGERLAISKIELDPRQRASLLQAAEFEGHADVPPQAYFSEAHLDTLGFCFWLAFAKREYPNRDAVLVIDDVFTSVDSPHLRRIADVLIDERDHFEQIIITTHHRSWREYYRHPHGAGKLTQLIELQSWTVGRGISAYGTALACDELRALVASMPFDRQSVAQRAGILLESVLDCLALRYRRPVPRSIDNAYTLNELLDGTSSLFKKLECLHPRCDDQGTPLEYARVRPGDYLARVRECQFLRNQVGAHFNYDGMNHSDRDVQAFAQATLDFIDALTCPTCGQIPSRNTGTAFKCLCPRERARLMEPLQLV